MSFLPSAKAQIDSTALRAKFGPPLNRETFHLPAGFDLAVDYSARGRVCQMQMPALMPSNAPVTNADDMKKAMYNFLAELVPSPMRGKEKMTSAAMMGVPSILTTDYENVTISEVQSSADPFDSKHTITVRFKNERASSVDLPVDTGRPGGRPY